MLIMNNFVADWEQCATPEEAQGLLDAYQHLITDDVMQQMKTRTSQLKESAGIPRAVMLVESMLYAAQLTKNPLHQALALMAQGNAVRWQGDNRRAVSLYDEAQQMALLAGNELEAARSQVGKIFALNVLAEYQPAIEVGLAARQVLLAHSQLESVIRVDNNLGQCYWRLGLYDKTLELYKQDLQMLDEALAAQKMSHLNARSLAAAISHNISLVLADLNRYQEALQTATEAFELHRELGNFIEMAKQQEIIGFYNLQLGHFNRALRLLDEAREVFVANNEKDYILYCDLYIIQCHLALNRFDLAAERCQQVLDYLQADQREVSYEAGRVNHYLGVALTRLGRRPEALASFEQSRRIFLAINASVVTANPTLDQAEMHYQHGEYGEAEKLCKEAREIFQVKGVLAEGARCDILLSKVWLAQGQVSAANDLAILAQSAGQTAHTPLVVYQALLVQAEIAEKRGDSGRALELYRAGLEAVEEMRGRVAAEARATFVEDKNTAFQGAVALSLEAGQWPEALELVERGKSRGLVELLAGQVDIRVRVRAEADRDLVTELESYRARRNEIISRLANWSSTLALNTRGLPALEAPPETDRGQLLEQLRDYEKRIRNLVDKLQVRNAAYAEDVILQPPEAKIATECLDEDTVLVEYYICRDEVLAFVVSQHSIQAVRQLSTEKGINQPLTLLRVNLAGVTRTLAEALPAKVKADRIRTSSQNARALLQKLYQQLIAPLADHLKDYRKLIIVPHGQLHYLPFHALFNGTSKQYLLEEWEEISYLPSGSLLSFCHKRSQRPATEQGQGALIMGHSSNQQLPHCPDEARQVADLLCGSDAGGDCQLYLEEAATPERFEEQAGERRLIHLATHGQFRQDDPLFSSLLLAGGELTAQDLFNCELKASLVTFSACETGLGKLGGGDELMGLSRACLYAGASSLVMSLWQVEDESVARLMQSFYTRLLAGKRKGAALREAQIELLQDENYRHPFFWAPFNLIGHSGSL